MFLNAPYYTNTCSTLEHMYVIFGVRTEVVALAQQLQEAEELADLVVVLQVLPVRAGISHA